MSTEEMNIEELESNYSEQEALRREKTSRITSTKVRILLMFTK